MLLSDGALSHGVPSIPRKVVAPWNAPPLLSSQYKAESFPLSIYIAAVLSCLSEAHALSPRSLPIGVKEDEVDTEVIPQPGLFAIVLHRVTELIDDMRGVGRGISFCINPQSCAVFLERPHILAGITCRLMR